MSQPVPPPPPSPRRPVTVNLAAALLCVMALAGLAYAVLTVASAPGTVNRFHDATAAMPEPTVDGFVTVIWIGAAVSLVLAVILAALFPVLALNLRRGNNSARLATLIVGGLGFLAGIAAAGTVVLQRTGDGPADGTVGGALADAYPTYWVNLNLAVAVAQVLAYAVVVALVVLTPGAFFGRRPKDGAASQPQAPGGGGFPAQPVSPVMGQPYAGQPSLPQPVSGQPGPRPVSAQPGAGAAQPVSAQPVSGATQPFAAQPVSGATQPFAAQPTSGPPPLLGQQGSGPTQPFAAQPTSGPPPLFGQQGSGPTQPFAAQPTSGSPRGSGQSFAAQPTSGPPPFAGPPAAPPAAPPAGPPSAGQPGERSPWARPLPDSGNEPTALIPSADSNDPTALIPAADSADPTVAFPPVAATAGAAADESESIRSAPSEPSPAVRAAGFNPTVAAAPPTSEIPVIPAWPTTATRPEGNFHPPIDRRTAENDPSRTGRSVHGA